MGRHDASYRRLFYNPRLLHDLCSYMIGDEWANQLDWKSLEPLPADYVSDDLRKRDGDRVWRIPYRGISTTASLYILLILEHQHRPERHMALRIMTYTGLLYETLLQSKLIGRRARLPAILPVVVYSGVRPWRAPLALSDLLEPASAELAAYQPQMRYLLVDEGALVRAGELPDDNLAAMLFRLEHSEGLDEMRELSQTLYEMTRSPEWAELRRAFTAWIRHNLLPRALPGVEIPEAGDLVEINNMLAERSRDWTRQWKMEGRQQGQLEGQAMLLERQLIRKFGALPDGIVERLQRATANELEAWSLNFVDATSLDDVFG